MIRKLIVASIAVSALTVAACQKQEEAKVEEAAPAAEATTPAMGDTAANTMVTDTNTAAAPAADTNTAATNTTP